MSTTPEAGAIVVSFRTDDDEARRTLQVHGIRFGQLILSSDPERGQQLDQRQVEWKASVVNQISPDRFFKDMPEVVCRIEQQIHVFLPCDEVNRGWLSDAVR